MLKKIFMMVVFIYASTQLILPEDLFRILEDTPAWRTDNRMPPKKDSTATMILNKDTVISDVSEPYISEVNGIRSFCNTLLFENIEYSVPANTFTAEGTEEIFDESFLTSADPQSKIWINAYFLDVMRTGTRDILIPHEQRHVDYINRTEEYIKWHDVGAFDLSLVITQGTISIGGLSPDEFWIRRIEHIPNGYCVTVTWNLRITGYYWDTLYRSMRVHLPERKKDTVLYLYFVIDGDYLDVYYKEDMVAFEKTYCTTYALVDYEIRKQIDGIIGYLDNYNTHPTGTAPYDPSKITFWPRRADGSMDYPPPLNMSNYVATHRTLDNLRLRDTASTSAKLVTTLPKGTEVQLIETGPATTIDGISAHWVRVTSGNGYTGWCFNGYLEEIRKPDVGNSAMSQGPDIGAGVAGDGVSRSVAAERPSGETVYSNSRFEFIVVLIIVIIILAVMILAVRKRRG